jgi:polar amino acid transport system permease protein
MVIIFFALPFMGISMGSILTTVLALSLGYGAYASECFRAGIESVHSGQLEAARSLGLSRWKTIAKIILPSGNSGGYPATDRNSRSDVKGYSRGIGSGGAGIVKAGPGTVYQ